MLDRLSIMRTTIDSSGRLVIPLAIRRQAGLVPGMVLAVRWKTATSRLSLPCRTLRLFATATCW